MKKKFKKLIDVKSIVTLILTFVFSILSLKNKISSEQFQMIFTTVIAFYFGTQHEKIQKRFQRSEENVNIEKWTFY